MIITEMSEYAEGVAWAEENLDRLRERFTGKDLQTQELRDVLWPEAEHRYPSQRESIENDLRATAWVAGAIKTLSETMRFDPEGMSAVFEVALEMGSIFGAELAKHEALEVLKGKSRGWWMKKAGDASPNELMEPVYRKWWRDIGDPAKRSRTSKWEALKYVFESREMRVLENLKKIEKVDQGVYVFYDVDSEEGGFQIMVKDAVHPGGIVSQQAGDIVG